jgi:hypothetical protein
LTWAFFLAGASATDLLPTGATKAQDDDSSENPSKRSEAPPDEELPNDVLQKKNDLAEAEIFAPAAGGSPTSHVAPLADMAQPQWSSPAAGQAPPAGMIGGSGAGGSAAQGRTGSGGDTDNSLPTLLPEIGVTEQTAPPPIDVHIGLTPLLGFEVNIEAGGVIAGLGLDLNNLLVGPLQGVSDLVDSVVSDLGTLLNNDLLGLGELLEPSPLNLAELTGLTLTDGIAGLLEARDEEPSGEPPAALFDSAAGISPLTAALITNAGEFSAPDILSAGDVIEFPVRALAPVDDLYAQGQHTDYNIALHDNAQTEAGETSPTLPDPAVVLPDALLSPNDQLPTDSATVEVSPFDEFATRPAV